MIRYDNLTLTQATAIQNKLRVQLRFDLVKNRILIPLAAQIFLLTKVATSFLQLLWC